MKCAIIKEKSGYSAQFLARNGVVGGAATTTTTTTTTTMYAEAVQPGKEYGRSDGIVPVIVVYRRPVEWSDRVLQLACGEFTHCELYVPNFKGTFVTTVDFGMELRFDMKDSYRLESHKYAWHLIPLTQAEYKRLCAWNMEQVKNHCKYNWPDLLWQVAPFMRSFVHDLAKQDASHPKKMFCSQAVVLALRAAFGGDGRNNTRMKACVRSMNSRITTPGLLSKQLIYFTGFGVNTSPVPVYPYEVNKYTDEVLERTAQAEHNDRRQ